MAFTNTWAVDADLKTLKYSSGSAVDTLRDFFIEFVKVQFYTDSLMDDRGPMTGTTLLYTLREGWFIPPDHVEQYLKGASLVTEGWANNIRQLTFDAGGYVNAVAGDVGKTVTGGTTGDTGKLLYYDNTSRIWWVRVDDPTPTTGDVFDATEAVTIASGTGAGTMSAASLTGEWLFSSLYSIGTIESGTQIYIDRASGLVSEWWSTGHIDVLLRVRANGSLIDNGEVTVWARKLGDSYDFFEADLSAGGRTAIPLTTQDDPNDDETGSGVGGVTIDWTGGFSADFDQDGSTEPYDVEVDLGGSVTIANWHKYAKYITRRGAGALPGTASPGLGERYKAADAAYLPIKGANASPFGVYNAPNLVGARGILLTNLTAGDANSVTLTDANGVSRKPPVSVALTVTRLNVSDKVTLMRLSGVGGTVVRNEYTLNGTHSIGAGTVVVNEAIKTDTPSAGTIRLGSTGVRYAYSAVNTGTKTFTLTGTLAEGYSGGDPAFVPFIDGTVSSGSEISNSVKYNADVPVLAIIRQPGYEDEESEGSITSAGFALAANRRATTL